MFSTGGLGAIEDEMPRRNLPEAADPATADQVARVVFLASDAADHVTETELWVDGAESPIGESWPKAALWPAVA